MAKTISDKLRLPSWSWISVDGPVLYPYSKSFQTVPVRSISSNGCQHLIPLDFYQLIPKVESL